MELIDRFIPWLDAHGRMVLPAVVGVVTLAIGIAFFRRLRQPAWTPEQLWKLKKETIKLLEIEYRGVTCAAAAEKLSVPSHHLKVVLEELIQDRFAVTVREGGGETMYLLKRFQENPVS